LVNPAFLCCCVVTDSFCAIKYSGLVPFRCYTPFVSVFCC